MSNGAVELQQRLVSWRRDFHAHPELGFQERRSGERVAEELSSLGYRVKTGVGRTGVVGELGSGKPVIAIRADMDALPIQEQNTVPYASKNAGVMHACGHDAHTAMALGAATILAESRRGGTIRLLFQPSEETEDPEGLSGAPRMIEAGALDGVDAVVALHVDPSLPVGEITLSAGPVSAGVDNFFATISGKGGHAAKPHEAIDPIYITSLVVLSLHGIVSRRVHPATPAVLSIGAIHGGAAANIIPDSITLAGTVRFTNTEVQEQMHSEVEGALSVARALGGDYSLKYVRSCPPLVNHEKVVGNIQEVATELLGTDHIRPAYPQMGGEDFSFFCNLIPGAMFGLGCRIEGDERIIHNPNFDLDESCLPIGASILAQTALRILNKMTFQQWE